MGKCLAKGSSSGVIGIFSTPELCIHAVRKTREAQYLNFDVFTPFPIHGMDEAQGLKRSKLPWVTFLAGMTGCTLGYAFIYWTSVVDWPLIVGGKPFNSWPAFVPILFELTVLFGGICTFLGMLAFNRLPNACAKIYDESVTNDKFVVWIGAEHDENEAMHFLQNLGAEQVRQVASEGWF